jgi:hypothetical protein
MEENDESISTEDELSPIEDELEVEEVDSTLDNRDPPIGMKMLADEFFKQWAIVHGYCVARRTSDVDTFYIDVLEVEQVEVKQLAKEIKFKKMWLNFCYTNPDETEKKAKEWLGDDVLFLPSTKQDKKIMVYNPAMCLAYAN